MINLSPRNSCVRNTEYQMKSLSSPGQMFGVIRRSLGVLSNIWWPGSGWWFLFFTSNFSRRIRVEEWTKSDKVALLRRGTSETAHVHIKYNAAVHISTLKVVRLTSFTNLYYIAQCLDFVEWLGIIPRISLTRTIIKTS